MKQFFISLLEMWSSVDFQIRNEWKEVNTRISPEIRFYLHKDFRVAGIEFCLHKEFCTAEIWIWSTFGAQFFGFYRKMWGERSAENRRISKENVEFGLVVYFKVGDDFEKIGIYQKERSSLVWHFENVPQCARFFLRKLLFERMGAFFEINFEKDRLLKQERPARR